MGFLLNHCRFGKLSSEIIDQCQPYHCKNDADINSFFHHGTKDNYADYEKERMAVSHCFFTEEAAPRMVCAFSLSSTALRVDYLPGRQRNAFNRKKRIPNNKRRSQYPATLIGQLCVFDGFGAHSFSYGDVGKEMMDLIKTMALVSNNDVASRYLIVDASNNQNVLDYYRSNGFEFLFESESEEISFMRSDRKQDSLCQRIKALICRSKEEFEKKLKTRLMYFDLILLKA